ncbi:TadE/TadG family type IV pilus assembly protein [Streptomyces orinoci]|uniref:TadE/TadG family type IV pilus assembly protein n=1 Tax=Streptomyces orinoci TaxID=67339 RepID=A0ABV3JSD4_STRON|nr:TadE/TadG family type IV pilus assembly protein [Streptomyces orinoci]
MTADDRGQTSVEFLGLLPLILLVLAILWECVLAGYTYTLAGDAADRGARQGAAAEPDGDQAACRQAALAKLGDAWRAGAQPPDCHPDGPDLYRARVTLKVPVLFPALGQFPLTVSGEASAAREPAP